MNPGPTEEAGKFASGVLEALKNQPVMLVLVLMNLIFIAAIFFAVRDQRHYQHELMKALVEQLAKCSAR